MTSFLQKSFSLLLKNYPLTHVFFHSMILIYEPVIWFLFKFYYQTKTSDCSLRRVCCLFYIYHSEPPQKMLSGPNEMKIMKYYLQEGFLAICMTQWISLEVRITIQVLNCVSWCETSAFFWVLFPWWLISKTSYYIEPQD